MKTSWLALVPVALWTSAVAAVEPTLVRIAIIDNSPSMQGERIAVVRRELSSLTAQLPPSPQYPLVLIVFDQQAAPPQSLTNPAEADAAIARLTGDGNGTRIAAGLDAATRLLSGHSASNVVLLLFTDGEDSHADELRAAETRLDRLFAERRRQGLNHSVFVKRWGNANAELAKRFVDAGHTDVIDAGELSVAPLLFDPQITVVRVSRDAADPRQLEIVLAPQVRLTGKLPPGTTAAFRFRCLRPGSATPWEITLPYGGPTQTYRLRVAATSSEEAVAHLMLPFEVRLESHRQGAATTLALPILLTTHLEVSIPLPIASVEYAAAATLRDVAAPAWSEPTACRATVRLTVSLTFTTTAPLVAETACHWRVVPLQGLRIVGGDPEVIVRKPGSYLVPLTVETKVTRASQPLRLSFRCEAVDAGPHRFTPAALTIEDTAHNAPPPVTSSIAASVVAVRPALDRRRASIGRIRGRHSLRNSRGCDAE